MKMMTNADVRGGAGGDRLRGDKHRGDKHGDD
jgi:hypothetical protein